ncbi:MAG: hypothetical protein K2K56_09570 [Lachnospiraceae bacterium]|nr:hypothetical protein [Lachnospiraceae bacterium]
MTQQDMILLVKAQEDILKMDILLKRLTGLGHSNGEFINLDNIFEVIRNNVHCSYHSKYNKTDCELDDKIYDIITKKNMTAEQKAAILLQKP